MAKMPFIRMRQDMEMKDFLNMNCLEATRQDGGRIYNGDLFGVELEMEGRNVSMAVGDDVKDWLPHRDGSLRNNHGDAIEWVFAKPLSLRDSKEAVVGLFKGLDKAKARLVTSNRTSTHVHFNMSDKAVYQVINLYLVFTVLEDLLDEFCGPDRNGNLFCLSTRLAEYNLELFNRACFTYQNFRDFGDEVRYSSLNLCSLNKFGSVEFRGMRGLDNPQDVNTWLDILNELCQYACYKMVNPFEDLILGVSVKTPQGFLQEVFSPANVKYLIGDKTPQEVSESIYEGLRLVQMTCSRLMPHYADVIVREPDFWAKQARPNPKKIVLVYDEDGEDEEVGGWDIDPEADVVQAGIQVPQPAPPIPEGLLRAMAAEAEAMENAHRIRARLPRNPQPQLVPAQPQAHPYVPDVDVLGIVPNMDVPNSEIPGNGNPRKVHGYQVNCQGIRYAFHGGRNRWIKIGPARHEGNF